MTDIWDPNTWDLSPKVCRVYGDPHATVFAEVDEEDYGWAINWLWHHKRSRGGKKLYICRQLTDRSTGIRANSTLMLHIEIMKRTGIEPPTGLHTIVDHRDGNSLNCRRDNLRWVTPKMNRMNLFGSYPQDLFDARL